ncbi:AraC family transcriptional regulator [Niveispirillum lacus]|uniref:AraC family transcriptional regulator n=1 Tax=Niveispirillum lacus TaxID=1981099 RepID=A0A255YUG0_9PROT|nr:helix-turn-helix domain-containing protein [Niveispirillum lacus]OYQ32867.1 AraC family transcriptional regulator [Niveispirillum lacus]
MRAGNHRGQETSGQQMIPVYVVLPPRAMLLDVAGPTEVLRRAGVEQDRIAFTLTFVGPMSEMSSSVGLLLSGIAPLPDHLPPDAVILLSGNIDPLPGQDVRVDDEYEQVIVDWLRRSVRPDHLLLCICSGSVIAARAGLMAGKACTTHHSSYDDLRRAENGCRVLENRLFVEDGNCWSSAGITAGIDLALHFVSRRCGAGVAAAVARYLVVYMRRAGADPQLSPWLEGRNHLHPAIHRVQDAIANDPAHDWSLTALANIAHASPRHLSRLFREHAGMTIPDYVNRLRVGLARRMIENSRLDMEAVAERAGFGSTRQLRRAWGRLHDAPPSTARRVG